MKAEDKLLTQQFLDLGARIRNLQHHVALTTAINAADNAGNGMSRSSSASQLGLNGCVYNSKLPLDLKLSPNSEEDYLGEFRDRTVSLVGLTQQKKAMLFPKMTKRKYRTEEYL